LGYLAVLDQVVRDAAAVSGAETTGEGPLPGFAPA
jgi:hypothetical protein